MDTELGALLSLDGQVAIVTGAATGIGEGIARLLHRAGATVIVSDVDDGGAARVAADLGTAPLHLDVTDAASAQDGIDATVRDHGRIDILVNNAGTYLEAGSILDQSHESWHRSIDVNLVGVFNCAKAAAIAMVGRGGGGSIVNISSVDGLLPCLGTGYDSAKAAVIHFTRSLAVDLAPHQIRVNGVAPGNVPVPTLDRIHSGELPPLWPPDSSTTGLMGPMMRQRSRNIPLGRKGTTDDIAQAVLYLCTPLSSYVTGHTLTVDGGWTLV
jgi:NAD(P)-dependent dehydrogenase (short-subunit alcohol dehydrogenase family)